MLSRDAVAGISVARVMAHCGGDLRAAVPFVARAIAAAPEAPEPYAVLSEMWDEQRKDLTAALAGSNSLPTVVATSFVRFLEADMDNAVMALGSVTGAQPSIEWARAPWFSDPLFTDRVGAQALAEAVMRTTDYGHDLDTPAIRDGLSPWRELIGKVCDRAPAPAPMAKMAIFLRTCGLTDESFALCDRADSVERIMLTEVVRAATWRKIGNPQKAAAAFHRALAMEPDNWSLYLDLADLQAEQGDFAGAVQSATEGLKHGPTETTLRAAGAAYRARHSGDADALEALIALAPQMPNGPYRAVLIDHACAGEGMPPELIARARRLR